MASERPRRTVRVPTKYQDKRAVETTNDTGLSSSKRRKVTTPKLSHDDPDSVDFLLKNPKSPLVNLELSTLINEHTWSVLPQDSRTLLSNMLPPTILPFTQPGIHPLHPANRHHALEEKDAEPIDVDSLALASEPDVSFFTDAFFEAAAKTFQDHLYSGWLMPAHEALVQEYRERINTGESHIPWKDEVWDSEHPATSRNTSASDGLAGDASSLSLADLAKYSVVRVGDVLAYRRSFSQLNVTVAKDVLIRSIHPAARSLTVLAPPSTRTHLPIEYLRDCDMSDDEMELGAGAHVQEMTITNPSQLENALLDIDARIEKARRPNGNAWKCLGVWRWRDNALPLSAYATDSAEAARGGREYRGTLFYLRGCFYDDQ